MIISKQFSFEASHILLKHPGKCSRLHGHSWRGEISIQGRVNEETGFVMDYLDLGELIDELIEKKLDHTHLGVGNLAQVLGGVTLDLSATHRDRYNASIDIYPSSENIVLWIMQQFVAKLPTNARLWKVSLKETCTSEAIWLAEEYQPIVKRALEVEEREKQEWLDD